MKRVCRYSCAIVILGVIACSTGLGAENAVQLVIRADAPGARISPAMYGIFFEDINFGADGGLYAEPVKNRSFEFPTAMMGWSEVRKGTAAGSLATLDQHPLNTANPHYLRITTTPAGDGYGVVNEGLSGMGVHKGEDYLFSLYARGDKKATLRIELTTTDGRVLAQAKTEGLDAAWTKKSATLRPAAAEGRAGDVGPEGRRQPIQPHVSALLADCAATEDQGFRLGTLVPMSPS